MVVKGFPFDVEEAQRSGTFISGMPGSGKTVLAKQCVRRLLRANVKVFVFDPSEAWTLDGPVKDVIRIFNSNLDIQIPGNSVVFDMKRLYVEEQQIFVQNFCKRVFSVYVEQEKGRRESLILLFEEAQIYLPQGKMRAKVAQEIMRFINVGRNFKLRPMIITQFAANVDKSAVKPCGQKFMGFTDEPNDKSYLSGWTKNRTEELESLPVGSFLYKYKKTLKLINVPNFTSRIKPMFIVPILRDHKMKNKMPLNFVIEKNLKLAMSVGALYGAAIVTALIAILSRFL